MSKFLALHLSGPAALGPRSPSSWAPSPPRFSEHAPSPCGVRAVSNRGPEVGARTLSNGDLAPNAGRGEGSGGAHSGLGHWRGSRSLRLGLWEGPSLIPSPEASCEEETLLLGAPASPADHPSIPETAPGKAGAMRYPHCLGGAGGECGRTMRLGDSGGLRRQGLSGRRGEIQEP